MTTLLSVIILCAFGAYALHEHHKLRREELAVTRAAEDDIRRTEKVRVDIAEREVAVKEWELRLKERQMERAHEKPAKRDVMPPDLVGRIAKWEDEWAQEDERRYLLELYAELGTWDAVRTALRPLDTEVQT